MEIHSLQVCDMSKLNNQHTKKVNSNNTAYVFDQFDYMVQFSFLNYNCRNKIIKHFKILVYVRLTTSKVVHNIYCKKH